jgi:hypothetical protein
VSCGYFKWGRRLVVGWDLGQGRTVQVSVCRVGGFGYRVARRVVAVLTGLSMDRMSAMLPYSCPVSRICVAYADCGSLFLVYLICSLHLILRVLLVCPTYALWHVWHSFVYSTFFEVVFGVAVCCSVFWAIVLLVLYAVFVLVCLNRLVTFLIFGEW